MKLREITVRKAYLKKLTTKDASGSYDSTENQAESTMTFGVDEGEDIEVVYKTANQAVQKATKDLLDEDPGWIKEKQ